MYTVPTYIQSLVKSENNFRLRYEYSAVVTDIDHDFRFSDEKLVFFIRKAVYSVENAIGIDI